MSDYHQMHPTITIVFRHFPRAPGQISFLLKCASANLRGFFSFFFIFFFQQSQACQIVK